MNDSSSSSESPPSKRARLIPVSSKKACIVSYCSEVVNEFYYNVYIVDLVNSEMMRQQNPTFRIVGRDFGDLAFCVFGSNIYFFGGFHESVTTPASGVDPLTRSVYTVDLSSFDLTTQSKIIVGKSSPSCVEVCPCHPRRAPVAVQTPDPTEFLVFSSFILEESDFEIFNPVKASWTTLPSLPNTSRTWVTVCTFLNDSILFIQTRKNLFIIDVKSWQQGWKPLPKGFCGPVLRHRSSGDFRYVFDGILTLDPYGYHDIRKNKGFGAFFPPPLSSFDQYSRQEYLANLVRLFTLIDYDVGKGLCTHAVLQVWRYHGDDGLQPRMILDVFDADINKYKQDLLKGESSAPILTIKKLVTLKFFDASFIRFIPHFVAVF